MIPELGHFCLILAWLCAIAQAAMPAISHRAAKMQCSLCFTAFLALIWSYVTSDFTVLNVAENSHTLKPLLYKISGTWGNHEGSMLLWVVLLSFYGALMTRQQNNKTALRVQGGLNIGFLAFLLFASNPFTRIVPPPIDGNDLNPLLQDPALAFHPPLLYMGYIGFSVAFSYALAALLTGKLSQSWAKTVKPWILFSWTTLTAGIALGSWWAYYELGWGGWWFWDPVENASLMPWLLGTALLHSVIVLEKRGGLPRWTVLLALLTFSLSMLGTFLVRSGILTSVHAFALDPARGVFILCLLSLYSGGALLFYALRASRLSSETVFSPLSREGALLLNNLFLTVIAATILTGTLYPLFMDALNMPPVSVGPPYFHATVFPLAIPMILLMAAGPLMPWKKADIKPLLQKLKIVLLLSFLVMCAATMINNATLDWSIPALGLSAWLITNTLAALPGKRNTRLPLRLKQTKLAQWGLLCAHLGLGIAIAGMVGTGLWTQDTLAVMKTGDQMTVGTYTLTMEKTEPAFGKNYTALRAVITAQKKSQRFTIAPEKRFYPAAQKNTSEAAIRTSWHDDLYIVMGDRDSDQKGWVIHAKTHPLVPFLWLGFAIMVLGGMIGFIACLKEAEHGK